MVSEKDKFRRVGRRDLSCLYRCALLEPCGAFPQILQRAVFVRAHPAAAEGQLCDEDHHADGEALRRGGLQSEAPVVEEGRAR